MYKSIIVRIITIIFLLDVIAVIECDDAYCLDPACILKPGEFCVDTKKCEVLYCSTMWFSYAQISRHKCLGMDEIYYEKFYLACQLKDCQT